MSKEYDVLVHTDGGGNGKTSGAAACIVQIRATGITRKVVRLLGPIDGAGAEMQAVILAFHVLEELGVPKDSRILWKTDSQQMLRYLKTQSERFPELNAVHVGRDSGDPRNVACDKVCRWVQRKAMGIRQFHFGQQVRIGQGAEQGAGWEYLFDPEQNH